MEYYCDVHLSNNDDEYLLDDKNTQPLLLNHIDSTASIQNCIKCEYNLTTQNGHTDQMVHVDDVQFWSNKNINFLNHSQSFSSHTSSNGSGDTSLLLNEAPSQLHCHLTTPFVSASKRTYVRLILSMLLCLIFMLAEAIGGIISGSLALISDAAHMLTDVAATSISLAALYIGTKVPTKRYPFGYYRAEILGALLSMTIIWVLSAVLVHSAIKRLISNKYEIQTRTMLIISIVGLIVNIVQICILHGVHPHNSHSHKEHRQNINVRTASLHVLGDLLQSVGVVLAAVVITYFPNLKCVDPACTIFFAVIVIFSTRPIFCDAINALMERFPKQQSYDSIYQSLTQLEHVKHVHSLKVWSLTLNCYNLTVHLAIDNLTNSTEVLYTAASLLKNEYQIQNSTIQVELFNENVMSNCPQCRIPPN